MSGCVVLRIKYKQNCFAAMGYSNFGCRTKVLQSSVSLQQRRRSVLFFSYCFPPGSTCTIIVFITIPSVITQTWYWNISSWQILYGSIIVYRSMIIIFNICNYLGKVICSYPCWSRLELFMTLLLKQNGSLALALALFKWLPDERKDIIRWYDE